MSLVVPFNEIFAKEIGLLAKHHTWERIEIKFVAEIINGFAFKSNLFSKNKGFPIIRIRDISKGKLETYYTGDYSEEYVVLPGDLLIGMDGNFICCGWKGREGLLNQRVCKIITNEKYLIKKFLLYGINGYLSAIHKATSSVTVAHLSSLDIARIPFPLPPLNEQRRIVAKLEKLLAKVDTCKERLDKIPAILKRFRQSVLSAACSGRLTADWRENNPDVESAEELLKRIQDEREKRYEDECEKAKAEGRRKPKAPFSEHSSVTFEKEAELPISWCVTLLGNITQTQGGIQKTPKRKPVNNPYPYLRVANVYRGYLKLNEIEYFELLSNELETLRLKKGDLLIVEGNGSPTEIGRCAIWSGEIENCVHQNHIIRSRPLTGITPYFLLTYLNSPQGIAVMMQLSSSTSGLHTLSVGKVNNIVVPIAPLAEQQEIVNRVATLFKTADQIEQRYQKARTYIDQLTQSILAKAFRGELVPQDSNDEPASVLLERIRAERENRENVAKTAKKPAKKQRSKKAQPQLEPIQLELPGIESNF